MRPSNLEADNEAGGFAALDRFDACDTTNTDELLIGSELACELPSGFRKKRMFRCRRDDFARSQGHIDQI